MSSARSASSRGSNARQLKRLLDKESVRSLSDWSPSASARSSRRSEYGPPTGRLRLDLSEVGGGGPIPHRGARRRKKFQTRKKHRQLFCGSDDPAKLPRRVSNVRPLSFAPPSGRSASTHTQRSDWTVFSAPTARSSARTVTARTATARSRCSQSSDSSRSDAKRSRARCVPAHRCSTKALPDVLKPISELSSSARRRLKIQIKASEKLQRKCKRSGRLCKSCAEPILGASQMSLDLCQEPICKEFARAAACQKAEAKRALSVRRQKRKTSSTTSSLEGRWSACVQRSPRVRTSLCCGASMSGGSKNPLLPTAQRAQAQPLIFRI